MEVNLSKKDIICLLRGVEISDYKTLFGLSDMGLVQYIGGFVDNYEWNSTYSKSWEKYSEEELYELYRKITK